MFAERTPNVFRFFDSPEVFIKGGLPYLIILNLDNFAAVFIYQPRFSYLLRLSLHQLTAVVTVTGIEITAAESSRKHHGLANVMTSWLSAATRVTTPSCTATVLTGEDSMFLFSCLT